MSQARVLFTANMQNKDSMNSSGGIPGRKRAVKPQGGTPPKTTACEQSLVWVLSARCETRVAKPRDERQSRESVGRGGRGWAKREPAPITVNFSFPPRKL